MTSVPVFWGVAWIWAVMKALRIWVAMYLIATL
jgi:hypothetical protein